MNNPYDSRVADAWWLGLFIGTTLVSSLACLWLIAERTQLQADNEGLRKACVNAGIAEWTMVPGGFKWKVKP